MAAILDAPPPCMPSAGHICTIRRDQDWLTLPQGDLRQLSVLPASRADLHARVSLDLLWAALQPKPLLHHARPKLSILKSYS